MPNFVNTPGSDSLADQASTMGDKIADNTTHFKENASELGRKAADTIDQNMSSAATSLDKAAATLHGRADNLPGVEKLSGLAHTTADKLSATAGYIREHDVDRIMKDVGTLVKNNPGPSLLVAGVVGFLLGRAFMGSNRD